MTGEDKSTWITVTVAEIRASDFTDYSKAALAFEVDRTAVLRYVKGIWKNWVG